MRSSTWLLRLSLVIPFAVIASSGCGSTSSGTKDSGPGSGGGMIGSGGGTGSGGSGGGGGADAGTACTSMDASAATIDAGTLWGCFENACMTQLAACASECACNNAVLAALQCVATGGNQMTCFTPVATTGTNGLPVATCLFTSTSGCNSALDAGSEGPADSGTDAAGMGD